MLINVAMMRSLASAGAGFGPADLCFLESVLARDGQTDGLRRLLADPEALRELLDLPVVHRALIEAPVALPVSASFYFYVLVRHAFLGAGIDDPGLADYVAGVLAEKLSVRPDARPGSPPGWLTRSVDFVAMIQRTSGLLRFQLEVAAGDQFLLLTGVFPGFLEARADRHGSPGLAWYESFGRGSYQRAAAHASVPSSTRQIFGLLAEVFPVARVALNRMSDRCLF